MSATTDRRRHPVDRLRVLTWVALILGSAVLLMPFVWMVKSSLSSEQVVQSGEVWVGFGSGGPQWSNYPESLARMDFTNALANTVFITFFSIVGMILSSSLVGFGFARFRFRGRKVLFMLMLSTMMLPPQVTMIPVFVLWKSLGVIDTFWPLVLPMCLAGPFFVFMFRQFFSQIPEDLVEAARIDGASNLRIYWQLMLPLSKPVIAITAIYTFMAVWNDFLSPLIYLNSPENRTLALALNAFRGQYGLSDAHLLMAASFVCMLPCLVLFFAAQRYFIEGVATSGMKG
ncbi:MAG: carbohydrate ABC transporter permease [Planctomycetota bacterium]